MGCACARRARHLSHRDNFKSRDIMDALDWPLTRMRSLHLYFLGVGVNPTPKTGYEMTPTYYSLFLYRLGLISLAILETRIR